MKDPEEFPMWGTADNMYADLVDKPKQKPEKKSDNNHGCMTAFIFIAFLIFIIFLAQCNPKIFLS